MNYDEMSSYLYNLGRFGMKLGLDPMKQALKHFNHPETGLKIIHIAGTNGKGSVAAMTYSILREAGFSVGMYTSPHLVDLRERIQYNGEKINKEDFLRFFNRIHEKNLDLTFFEFITLLGFLYFHEKNPDYVILEVGLGGSLDATNVCLPKLSVITNVSLDHIKQLGNTLELVTKDKCGIIKNTIPVITSNINPDIIDIITQNCTSKKSQLIISHDYEGELNLNGQFQKINAGIAVEIAKKLGINEEKIKNGLKKVVWPGRAEFIDKNILMDCAHNTEGIKAISEYVRTLNYKNLIVIFGVCKDKYYKEMLNLLPEYNYLIFTKADVKRALDPRNININCMKIVDPLKALEHAKSISNQEDLILITGSAYVIGNMMAKLKHANIKSINEFM